VVPGRKPARPGTHASHKRRRWRESRHAAAFLSPRRKGRRGMRDGGWTMGDGGIEGFRILEFSSCLGALVPWCSEPRRRGAAGWKPAVQRRRIAVVPGRKPARPAGHTPPTNGAGGASPATPPPAPWLTTRSPRRRGLTSSSGTKPKWSAGRLGSRGCEGFRGCVVVWLRGWVDSYEVAAAEICNHSANGSSAVPALRPGRPPLPGGRRAPGGPRSGVSGGRWAWRSGGPCRSG